MSIIGTTLKIVIPATVAVIAARLLFPLPSLEGRTESYSIPPVRQGILGQTILDLAEAHPGKSGVHPLIRGDEAFAARMLLARNAQHSIDARYYIWDNDLTGLPLLNELRAAAERGVRVRLLVDDNGTPGLDQELAALNTLDKMEVRIFNPFTLRNPRLASYLFDFPRLNRRMHNKSFSADGVATIIGGRNVGDAYFARSEQTQFSDFDLMVVGPGANDVAADFDLYWNSGSAYPHELIVKPAADGLAAFATKVEQATSAEGSKEYGEAILASSLMRSLTSGSLHLEWAEVILVSDDPAKGLGEVKDHQLMINRLTDIADDATETLDLVSAYFIPGKTGTQVMLDIAKKGVRVRALTNSLEATDVLPVHASYAKYREELIDGGIEVYELKHEQSEMEASKLGILGSSAASLHAKSFTSDKKRLFVGSFNFDPRSILLNCEMGFLVKSPELAQVMNERITDNLETLAWRVTRTEDGNLQWSSLDGAGNRVTLTSEPGASLIKRIALKVIGALPVEWLM